MMTDNIADMLTRIRNAQRAHKPAVVMPYSNLKKSIADLLTREGYVGATEKTADSKPELKIFLKYKAGKPAIQQIKRLSTPGHRVYRPSSEMPTILNGFGVAIVSTSHGVMTSTEAKKLGIGGEIICSVY